jgi:transcriptional regulator with XRE-family HTH domain
MILPTASSMGDEEKRPPADRGGASRKSGNVDVRIGSKVRLRRVALGLTLEELGARMGISLQQMQKYEAGATRISASRLYEIAHVLDAPITWFFDPSGSPIDRDSATAVANPAASLEDSLDHETQQLVRLFRSIKDPRLRYKIIELIELLAPPKAK